MKIQITAVVEDHNPARVADKIMKNKIIFIPIILFLAGCSSFPLISQLVNTSPQATTVGVLFQDDFSEKDSGWDRMASEVGSTDYDNEAYHIVVNGALIDLFSNPGHTFEDVIIEVTAARQSGPVNNSYGVICRYQDEKNFYAGLITSDGYAGIFEIKEGEYYLKGHDEMIAVPAILGGTGSNLIHFECVGKSLLLVVNGSPVDAQNDKSYDSGDVGLIAGTFDESGVHIVFDDFVVLQP